MSDSNNEKVKSTMYSEDTVLQFLHQLGAHAAPFNDIPGITGIRTTLATYRRLRIEIQIIDDQLLISQFVIGYLPNVDTEPLLRHLLILNSIMNGVYFCVFENINAILLRGSCPIEGLHYLEFKNSFLSLINAFLQQAHPIVQTFQISQNPVSKNVGMNK